MPASVEGNGSDTLMLLDCDADEDRLMPENSAVLHLGLCPSRGLLCMMHSAGPLPPGPFEQMVLLAKEAAEAVGVEIRRCLENRVEKRAVKRMRLISATGNNSLAAGAAISNDVESVPCAEEGNL